MRNLLILLFISSSIMAQPGGPSPVKTTQVEKILMAPERKVPANVEAKYIATLKTEYKGTIDSMADIGSFVKKGDVVAALVDSQAKLVQDELQAQVESDEARLQFVQSENVRLTNLGKQNMVSNSDLEQNKSDLVEAKNNLEQAKSRLGQHLDQIEKLTIKAPYDGVVLSQLAQPGQLVNSGNEVAEFMQTDKKEVVVNVPFKYRAQISTGSVWKLETTEGRSVDAQISQFVPAATGNSHTIEVRLTAVDSELWPGEAVNVLVPTQAKQEVIAVPRDALVIRNNGIYVYTVVDNKAHKVDVIPGISQGEMIQVKGLLSPGDEVIIRGNERLRNEQDVSVIN